MPVGTGHRVSFFSAVANFVTRPRGTAFRDGQRGVQSLEVPLGVDDRTFRCFEIGVGLLGLCGRFLKAATGLVDRGGRGRETIWSSEPSPRLGSGRLGLRS